MGIQQLTAFWKGQGQQHKGEYSYQLVRGTQRDDAIHILLHSPDGGGYMVVCILKIIRTWHGRSGINGRKWGNKTRDPNPGLFTRRHVWRIQSMASRSGSDFQKWWQEITQELHLFSNFTIIFLGCLMVINILLNKCVGTII